MNIIDSYAVEQIGPEEHKYDVYGPAIFYTKNGKLHRDGDLPAVINNWGDKEWWMNGKRHRDGDLPAIECENGNKAWYNHGKNTPRRRPPSYRL